LLNGSTQASSTRTLPKAEHHEADPVYHEKLWIFGDRIHSPKFMNCITELHGEEGASRNRLRLQGLSHIRVRVGSCVHKKCRVHCVFWAEEADRVVSASKHLSVATFGCERPRRWELMAPLSQAI
jgi:hypothetical protein